MKIEAATYNGEAMKRVYENEKWTVGIKNWKLGSDVTMISNLERHNLTDELFILLAGECTLIFANETDAGMKFEGVKMEPFTLYNIPCTLWHNAIMSKDARIAVIEDVSTGIENSNFYELNPDEAAAVRSLVK